MRKLLLSLSIVALSVAGASAMAPQGDVKGESELYEFLKKSKDVTSVEALPSGEFAEKYVVEITQPLDYRGAEGEFTQRFVVAHVHRDSINVMVTEGYVGDYAFRESYRDEISKGLNTNIIFVEHRYFSGSVPEPLNWDYMCGYNAANDLHRINQLMKQFYGEKRWLATGISKGGQNSIIYRTYFPGDVDVTVPYVAPICFGVEDGRHETFLDNVSTKEDRDKILEYQRAVLSKRSEIIPMLLEHAEKEGHIYMTDIDAILDYCVLELPFSTWQWGNSIEEIPSKDSDTKTLYDYLLSKSGPDYFIKSPTSPFFVQAARDLGYYGYDIKPLKDLLSIKTADGYLKDLFLDETAKDIKFDRTMAWDIESALIKGDHKMIFIYGEYDPWSAARAKDIYFKDKENMLLMIQEKGSHRARIHTLTEEQQQTIWSNLRMWLKRD